jgi:signal transduction histidine kinase
MAGLLAAFGLPTIAAGKTKQVLLLYAHSRLLPANVKFDRSLRETIANTDPSVEVNAEFLDYPHFKGETYVHGVTRFLRDKYALQLPDVVVAVGQDALDFLLRNRAELFPLIPVVHMGVDRLFLRSILPLPADVVGVPVEIDFQGTIGQALRWHPRANRLVVVTGSAKSDRAYDSRLRDEVTLFKDRATVEFLAGLPTREVLKRLGQLGENAIVFTPGYFEDGDGHSTSPREAARAMAATSTAPVYGPFDTFIGTGVVGGLMPSYAAVGQQAGAIVNRLLGGEAPASLHLPEIVPPTLNVDWRQIRRWGIDQNQIPSNAIVHFREPTLWEAHRSEVISTATALLLQTGLITWLLIERRRRRVAEVNEGKHRRELTHASRLAVAGELTGSIAHDINQPLGAILTNAAAADLILKSGDDRRDEVREILADIRRDDLRASEVIRRLRNLLSKREVGRTLFNIDDALREVAVLLSSEARHRKKKINYSSAPINAVVFGDKIEIEQAIINIILNAMDCRPPRGTARGLYVR